MLSLPYPGNEDHIFEPVSYSDLEARIEQDSAEIILINYWATWCKPCVEELPEINEFIRRHESLSISAYFVSLDFPTQIDSKLKPFVFENPFLGLVIVLDGLGNQDWIDQVEPSWSGALPATMIIKKSSGTKSFKEGKVDTDWLEKAIAE